MLMLRHYQDVNYVVPRTGYVDRNRGEPPCSTQAPWSYPARGTWIEMSGRRFFSQNICVVPRTGYVDRNTTASSLSPISERSYPARGTWIEISWGGGYAAPLIVVPRTGYVDRNGSKSPLTMKKKSRTPHGVRG